MNKKYADTLRSRMDDDSFAKLDVLANDALFAFIADAVRLCAPESIKVCTDDPADQAHVRQLAIDNREELPLNIEGHTVHFDGYFDQGRDKQVTKYLLGKGISLDKNLNSMAREEGLRELHTLFAGSMAGRQMLVLFFCLGPTNSPFSIPCAQITDSAYVGHSEYMMYRSAYEHFKAMDPSEEFFRFLHTSGRLVDNVSADAEKKRIYIDIADNTVYSVNTQYAGNTMGLKKLALRLAIRKADREGWLAEHMFVMGVRGPRGRKTYFTGAFPSACGKTSTAMLPGETIIGDDLAYFRVIDGQVRAVNVECGIFGIIRDVNPEDDPLIHKVLTRPGEVIFGNVLVKDGAPYWEGMGRALPSEGINYTGQWYDGKVGPDGKETDASHKNARYTIRIADLDNRDEKLDDPLGVPVGGIIYGGRDSDTSVPVTESFDWAHGIITMGASLESETTAATLGAEGVRTFNLMSNLDFLAIPLGKYIRNNLHFADDLPQRPRIFGTNYFLRDDNGRYLNGMLDKSVWIKWMELRVHGDVEAIEAPTGLIPLYDDLKRLFAEVLRKDYSQEAYVKQFTIRIPENLSKLHRIENIYRHDVADTPAILFEVLSAQRERLEALMKTAGEYVSPFDL
ncbi:MAG: phosphoenolpyruvate carboxykinase (GTP) [Planctomycetes bacterium]|nr:phosphoenolpyruvate carboxykinase (GTP) [Planctomycetota bacterium]